MPATSAARASHMDFLETIVILHVLRAAEWVSVAIRPGWRPSHAPTLCPRGWMTQTRSGGTVEAYCLSAAPEGHNAAMIPERDGTARRAVSRIVIGVRASSCGLGDGGFEEFDDVARGVFEQDLL